MILKNEEEIMAFGAASPLNLNQSVILLQNYSNTKTLLLNKPLSLACAGFGFPILFGWDTLEIFNLLKDFGSQVSYLRIDRKAFKQKRMNSDKEFGNLPVYKLAGFSNQIKSIGVTPIIVLGVRHHKIKNNNIGLIYFCLAQSDSNQLSPENRKYSPLPQDNGIYVLPAVTFLRYVTDLFFTRVDANLSVSDLLMR